MTSFLINASNFGARHKRVLIPCVLILTLLFPLVPQNAFYQDLLIMVLFWAMLSAAWNLIGGIAGQISLGHAGFFGIGAYTSTILFLDFGVSPWLGMFAGAGVAILVALFIGHPCFRLTSHFFALATIAFAEVLRLLASFWRELTNGGVGLLIPHNYGFVNFIFEDKLSYTYIILVLLLIVLFTTYFLKKSRFGYYLAALREDQNAAESLGVNTHRCKMIVLLISVIFTAIGGTFYAQYFAFIEPDIVFTSSLSIQLALLSIIGGMGTVLGPLVGSLFLTPLNVLLRGWLGGVTAGLNFAVYGVVLIIAVMYLPMGIVGWMKKFSSRHEENSPPETDKSSLTKEAIIRENLRYHVSNKTATLIIVDDISKRFGGLEAVKDLSFSVREGELVGLIGPNGAGKTTVFNLISGFASPDKGGITFKNKDITSYKMPHLFCAEGIGRTFQLVKPFQGMTVLENVMVGALHKIKNVKKARAESFKILKRIHLDQHAHILASNLTIADRKRLELGRALSTGPDLLLLDEVMAGLNPKETEDIVDVIRAISQDGVAILMIEHVMRAVMALSHRIIVINNGMKIAEGSPEEIAKDQRVIDAYLGEEYHVA